MLAINTGTALWSKWGYVAAFSLVFGGGCYLIANIPTTAKWSRRIGLILLVMPALWFITQALIWQSFRVFMSPFFLGENAEGVADSYALRVARIVASGAPLAALYALCPLAYLLLERRVPYVRPPFAQMLAMVMAMLAINGATVAAINIDQRSLIPDATYYGSGFMFNAAVPRFGLLTATRLDLEYALFGTPSDTTPVSISVKIPRTPIETPDPIDRSPNVLPFDFAQLSDEASSDTIKQLADYYAGSSPSVRNEYTGLFAGKNLILITAESFSGYMVSKELTPTLYKLIHEGFYFSDFYQPAWGGSTSTGEWSVLTGLFPGSAGALGQSVGKDLGFTIGNRLSSLGYTTYGFHNNNERYYKRNLTHPVLGYSNWVALGSGMENLPNPVTGKTGIATAFPQSDLEMMQVSLPLYIDKEPFNAYYITVSGHSFYTWDHPQAAKNRKRVEALGLPYHWTVQAYLAANLELEDALTYLLAELEAKGALDDTVIVLAPDHSPYSLEKNEYNSRDYYENLIGYSPEPVFEYYRNTWIIYNAATPGVEVSAPTYSLDILPTLLNLFGVEFDSRIFTGRDVFSPTLPLVIMPDYSWKTPYGTYYADRDVFEPAPNSNYGDTYARAVSAAVRTKVAMAAAFQKNDFWRVLQRYLR
ncbi:MAG: LTA synthase family protein [Propionibacteriaceae bacterium]|nr:LTA synthase family protein [Propionibacteriaceae bacterium]